MEKESNGSNSLLEPLLLTDATSGDGEAGEADFVVQNSSRSIHPLHVPPRLSISRDDDDVLIPSSNNDIENDINNNNNNNNNSCSYVLDPQRYAVLLCFSFCNLMASAVWITFAPIEDAVRVKYGNITATQVNWLSIVFMASYGPGTALCAWTIRRIGLRESVVAAAFTMVLGCLLRWWSIFFVYHHQQQHQQTNSVAYAILLTGQGLVAVAQPVFANAPARVAAAWFQKTTQAIGVSVFSASFGMIIGQAMSPIVVVEATGDRLGFLLFGQAVAMLFCATATWWYFEAQPSSPPSAAEAARRRNHHYQLQQQQQRLSSSDRDNDEVSAVWKDVKALATDRQYIFMLIAFGLGYGVNGAILTLLQPWIAAAGFPGDETAGMLGSLFIAGGMLGTVIAAPLLDASRKYNQAVRWSFLASFLVAAASVAILYPSCPKWILAVAFTAMGMVQLPVLTICLDAAAAHSYPIPEELSSAGLQLVGQYSGIVMIDFMGSLLTNGRDAQGFKGPFNIAFLAFLCVSALAAVCYNGDDLRATANHALASSDQETTVNPGESGAAVANTTGISNVGPVSGKNRPL